jgi:hypothetical protein
LLKHCIAQTARVLLFFYTCPHLSLIHTALFVLSFCSSGDIFFPAHLSFSFFFKSWDSHLAFQPLKSPLGTPQPTSPPQLFGTFRDFSALLDTFRPVLMHFGPFRHFLLLLSPFRRAVTHSFRLFNPSSSLSKISPRLCRSSTSLLNSPTHLFNFPSPQHISPPPNTSCANSLGFYVFFTLVRPFSSVTLLFSAFFFFPPRTHFITLIFFFFPSFSYRFSVLFGAFRHFFDPFRFGAVLFATFRYFSALFDARSPTRRSVSSTLPPPSPRRHLHGFSAPQHISSTPQHTSSTSHLPMSFFFFPSGNTFYSAHFSFFLFFLNRGTYNSYSNPPTSPLNTP